jgi:hypothetical protein
MKPQYAERNPPGLSRKACTIDPILATYSSGLGVKDGRFWFLLTQTLEPQRRETCRGRVIERAHASSSGVAAPPEVRMRPRCVTSS